MNPWEGQAVGSMLWQSARKWPTNLALVDGDTRISYELLLDLVRRTASGLEKLGVGPGTHVGFALAESWRSVVALYASLYCGATVVPLNPWWQPREMTYALQQSEVEVLIAGDTYVGRDLSKKLREAGVLGIGPVSSPRLPSLRHVLVDDVVTRSEAGSSLIALIETPTATDLADSQGKYIVYTSGTTAYPKGAVIRQSAALGTSYYLGERLGIDSSDHHLSVLPFYHSGGVIDVLLGFHQRGAAVHVFEGYQQNAMLRTLDEYKCTSTGGFDTVTMRLIRAQLARGVPLSIKKMWVAPGVGVLDFLWERGVDAITCYALTEASNIVALGDPGQRSEHIYSNGQLLPGIEARVCDYESGQELPPGTPGELCFRGWNQMDGYYKMAEHTRSVFDQDGYLHTGDYGSVHEGGWVYFRGRYSMMIKTGGENVSETEVEQFLMSECDGVEQAAVVGLPDEKWGEVVVAFVELTDSSRVDLRDVEKACREGLARYKVPKVFLPMKPGAWPLTATGKLIKPKLRELASERTQGK